MKFVPSNCMALSSFFLLEFSRFVCAFARSSIETQFNLQICYKEAIHLFLFFFPFQILWRLIDWSMYGDCELICAPVLRGLDVRARISECNATKLNSFCGRDNVCLHAWLQRTRSSQINWSDSWNCWLLSDGAVRLVTARHPILFIKFAWQAFVALVRTKYATPQCMPFCTSLVAWTACLNRDRFHRQWIIVSIQLFATTTRQPTALWYIYLSFVSHGEL